MSLSAGSSPLHSPKITPHTSPAPRRRSHTPNPNPVNYMVPTTASEQGGAAHIIQKETVGGTTYFYTDNTPAPMAGMVWSKVLSLLSSCLWSKFLYENNWLVIISGVSNVPYLPTNSTSCGVHAAQSQCSILFYGWRTPTGTHHLSVLHTINCSRALPAVTHPQDCNTGFKTMAWKWCVHFDSSFSLYLIVW